MRQQQTNPVHSRNLPKEHRFNFQVLVNYQNGNVKIKGPDGYCPPNINFIQPQFPPQQNIPRNIPSQNKFIEKSTDSNSSSSRYDSRRISTLIEAPYQQQNSSNSSRMLPLRSSRVVQCVICEKAFNIQTFEDHLLIHKNRARSYSPQNIKQPQDQRDPNIRYIGKQPEFKITNSSRRQQQYSFQNRNVATSKSNSLCSQAFEGNNSYQSKFLQSIEEVPMVGNIPSNNSFNHNSSNRNSMNHPSLSSHQNSFGNELILNDNISYHNKSSNKGSSFGATNQISRQIIVGHEIDQSIDLSRYSQGSSISDFPEKRDNGKQAKKFHHSYTQNCQTYLNSKNGQLNNNMKVSISGSEFIPEGLASVAFKKKNNQQRHQTSDIRYEIDDDQSSNEDVRETLQNLNREKMIEMSQSKKNSIFARSSVNDGQYSYSRDRQADQRSNASCRIQTDYKSVAESIRQEKPLSSHLHELQIHNVKTGQIFRGVQADEKDIMDIMKDGQSTNSKTSKMSKSSRVKMPRNNLAVFDHLVSSLPK